MGRPWRAWWRLGEQEWRDRVIEARLRCGECGGRAWVRRAGGGGGGTPFAGTGLVARVGPVRRCRLVLGGLAWCRLVLGGGGKSPALHGSAT